MEQPPGGPNDRREEIRAAALDARSWVQQRGCLFWGVVIVIGLSALGTCDRPVEPPPPRAAVASAGPVLPPASPPADKAGAVAAWADDMNAGMRLCETASTALSEAMSGGNRYRIYDAADLVEQRCDAVSGALANVPVPDWFDGPTREAADKARAACENSLLARRNVAREIKTVADGDQRPSALAAAREAADRVELTVMGCAAAQMVVAERAGVPAQEFIKASRKLVRARQ